MAKLNIPGKIRQGTHGMIEINTIQSERRASTVQYTAPDFRPSGGRASPRRPTSDSLDGEHLLSNTRRSFSDIRTDELFLCSIKHSSSQPAALERSKYRLFGISKAIYERAPGGFPVENTPTADPGMS